MSDINIRTQSNKRRTTHKAAHIVGTLIGAALSILALTGIIWAIVAVWRLILS